MLKGCLGGFFVAIFLVIVLVVGAAGWFGFVPGLSDLMGSGKPKDLGVTYTQADITSLHQKNKSTFQAPSSGASGVTFTGQHAVNATFTSAEITAAMNEKADLYPVTDVQFRVNADGTAEMSGKLHMNRIDSYARGMGATTEQIDQVAGYLKNIPSDPPVYIKGRGEIQNNKIVIMDISEATIGRISVLGQINDNQGEIISAFASGMQQVSGLKITSLKVVNGQVQFVGSLSDKVTFSK
jgi:hypothetical protein